MLPDGRCPLGVALGALAVGGVAAGALDRAEAAVLDALAEAVVVPLLHGARADGGGALGHLGRLLLAAGAAAAGGATLGPAARRAQLGGAARPVLLLLHLALEGERLGGRGARGDAGAAVAELAGRRVLAQAAQRLLRIFEFYGSYIFFFIFGFAFCFPFSNIFP